MTGNPRCTACFLFEVTARHSLTNCISLLPDTALPTVSVYCQMEPSQLHSASLLTKSSCSAAQPNGLLPINLIFLTSQLSKLLPTNLYEKNERHNKENWRAHIVVLRRVRAVVIIITATDVITLWRMYNINTVTFASVFSIVSSQRLWVWAAVTDMGGIGNVA